jgi:hypothetical protein
MLQFGASLTDDTRSVNYDCNTFIIQATGLLFLSKARSYLSGVSLCWSLDLTTNIELGLNWMAVANTLAYNSVVLKYR